MTHILSLSLRTLGFLVLILNVRWFSSFMVSTIYIELTVARSMKPTCFGCFSSIIIKVDSAHNDLYANPSLIYMHRIRYCIFNYKQKISIKLWQYPIIREKNLDESNKDTFFEYIQQCTL